MAFISKISLCYFHPSQNVIKLPIKGQTWHFYYAVSLARHEEICKHLREAKETWASM